MSELMSSKVLSRNREMLVSYERKSGCVRQRRRE